MISWVIYIIILMAAFRVIVSIVVDKNDKYKLSINELLVHIVLLFACCLFVIWLKGIGW